MLAVWQPVLCPGLPSSQQAIQIVQASVRWQGLSKGILCSPENGAAQATKWPARNK